MSFDRPSVSWAKPAVQAELPQPTTSDLEYLRRLEELMRSSNRQLQQQQQVGTLDNLWAQQQPQQQINLEKRPQRARRRKLNLDEIPMLGTSATHGACNSSSSTSQSATTATAKPSPSVDWRMIVEEARRRQQRVSGEQMLMDTFK
jgi:hypothetical protein